MSDAFRIETDPVAKTATVTLCRPDDGNRLGAADLLALGPAILDAGRNPDVKLVVIRGEGEHFCLGRAHAPKPPKPLSALEFREGVTHPVLEAYAHVRATPVPVLAAVHGAAEGFGCAIVGQCDLVISSDKAHFSLPEMGHNLPPTLAISALLHKVPRKQLAHLVCTRDKFSANQALAYDIVTKVVAHDDFQAETAAYISRLTEPSRQALCAVKEYMGTAPYLDVQAAARLGANLLATVFSSPEEASNANN